MRTRKQTGSTALTNQQADTSTSFMLQPHALINAHGQTHFGRFTHAVNEINVKDADYRTVLNKKASAFQKHFHFKQFQYFGGISKDVIFGCALADLRYLGAVFVYVYDIATAQLRTWQFKTPLALGMQLSLRPDKGLSHFKRGSTEISMHYSLNACGARKKFLHVRIPGALTIEAEMHESRHYEAMVLCTPTGVNGWTYAQKTAACPVSGEIKLGQDKLDLTTTQCFGHHDLSAGFMRRETFWNWACLSGLHRGSGQPLGLNVSWGVNETGYSENCFWLGQTLHPLPAVQFKFSRDDEQSPWQIYSENDQIKLHFQPLGVHKEKLNALFLASHFKQFFGVFDGYLRCSDGRLITLKNQYGFVEDQFARW